ncbi:hypothetical protein AO367_0432 [Moraxella catarrhalis]|nr:hypothetical protein AO367_0432 [Moraxella catarrhalis]
MITSNRVFIITYLDKFFNQNQPIKINSVFYELLKTWANLDECD